MPLHHCENCRLRRHADRKPNSLLARLWRWHSRWCPGWKAYQKSLAEDRTTPPAADDIKLPPPTSR